MGLLEMKSNLSSKESPNTGLGKSKLLKTAGPVPKQGVPSNLVDTGKSFSGQGFGDSKLISTAPPIPSEGVDYFTNINATGFTLNRGKTGAETDFILNDSGGPIIPQTAYLDIKGDFISIFSSNNKSFPNVYNKGTDPTPLQNLFIDTSNDIDGRKNFATTPNRFGFTFSPPFNEQNRAPAIRPSLSEQSRIYFKHLSDKSGIQNAGFTRNGLGLDNYYAQRLSDESIFSQRSNGKDGVLLPKIVRGIEQRWGDGGINIPFISDEVESFIDRGVSALNPILSPVFGRDVNVFTDTYKADIIRVGDFASPLSTYFLKQTFLHRQNKYDRVGSALYTDTNFAELNISTRGGDFLNLALSSGIIDINPQVYNPGSIFSVPGVPGMMFNKHGRNIQDLSTFAGNAANISLKALQFAAPAAIKVITKGLGNLAEAGGSLLGSLGQGLLNIDTGINFPGININPNFSDIRNPFSATLPTLNFTKKIGDLKSIQYAGSLLNEIGGAARPIFDAAATTAKTVADFSAEKFKKAKLFIEDAGIVGKANLQRLDPRAYEDVGVDRVNLIPYGSEKYKDDHYTALDLIPFKFVDARANKPIVFRAILSGITDTFSPEYASERYVGRPDNVYVYQGTNREISFNFDVYPKSDAELPILWEKLNYLAGLTYPHWDSTYLGMIAPFSKLTIGQMYDNAPGYISSLTYTIQDNGTWEVDFAKAPKYIQVACSFIYIGDRLPSATQKHYDFPWIGEEVVQENPKRDDILGQIQRAKQTQAAVRASTDAGKKFLKAVGL